MLWQELVLLRRRRQRHVLAPSRERRGAAVHWAGVRRLRRAGDRERVLRQDAVHHGSDGRELVGWVLSADTMSLDWS
jgi:hypothetical protein